MAGVPGSVPRMGWGGAAGKGVMTGAGWAAWDVVLTPGVANKVKGTVAGAGMIPVGMLAAKLIPSGIAVGIIEMLAFEAMKGGLNALDHAVTENKMKWRQQQRIGFHAADVFSQESGVLLSQRQASLRAIQGAIVNARSSIGNEAALMRRSINEYL